MNAPNFILYGQNQFGPKNIASTLPNVIQAGFTTIVFGMFHIGNVVEKKPGMKEGDIIFNGDEPVVIRDGQLFPDDPNSVDNRHWAARIGLLKAPGSTVNKIYASFGGAAGAVRDFETIKKIYVDHGNSFNGSPLKTNLLRFRNIFHMIDGIDMDCEETYEVESFVAFCRLLREMNFDITFCPYEDPATPRDGKSHPQPYKDSNFWTESLKRIEEGDPDSVKWWNLQCYAGGVSNDPERWAQAIKNVTGRPVDRYIASSDWVRFWDPRAHWDKTKGYTGAWLGHCPKDMTDWFSTFSKQACVGGGFVWDLDLIAATLDDRKKHPEYGLPCPDQSSLDWRDYLDAMKKGLGL